MANPMKSAASKERLRKLHLNNVKPDAAFNSALGNYKTHASHRGQTFSNWMKQRLSLCAFLCHIRRIAKHTRRL